MTRPKASTVAVVTRRTKAVDQTWIAAKTAAMKARLKGRSKTIRKATPVAVNRVGACILASATSRLGTNFGSRRVLDVAVSSLVMDASGKTMLVALSNNGLHLPLASLGVDGIDRGYLKPAAARQLSVGSPQAVYAALLAEMGVPGVSELELSLPLDQLATADHLRAAVLQFVNDKTRNNDRHAQLTRRCLFLTSTTDFSKQLQLPDTAADLATFETEVGWTFG